MGNEHTTSRRSIGRISSAVVLALAMLLLAPVVGVGIDKVANLSVQTGGLAGEAVTASAEEAASALHSAGLHELASFIESSSEVIETSAARAGNASAEGLSGLADVLDAEASAWERVPYGKVKVKTNQGRWGVCLRIRAGATTASRQVGCIPHNKVIKPICGITNGQNVYSYVFGGTSRVWHKIKYGSITGWISDSYTLTGVDHRLAPGEKSCTAKPTTSTTPANLKNCASWTMSCLQRFGYSGQRAWYFPVDGNGHNCTNYIAVRLDARNISWLNGRSYKGKAIFYGHAMYFDNNIKDSGAIRDGKASFQSTPRVGDVAQWEGGAAGAGSLGHVAYVEKVFSNGDIIVSESNWGGQGKIRKITKSSGYPTRFIRLKN